MMDGLAEGVAPIGAGLLLLRDDDLVLTLSLAAPGTNARGTDTSRGAR